MSNPPLERLEGQLTPLLRSLETLRLISRYLTTARELGIVRITIAAPEQGFEALSLSVRVRHPHLKAVIIAPIFSDEPDAQRAMIGRVLGT